jgi:hypothetical protein
MPESSLPGAASRTREALPERHLTHEMNKFTLLDDAVGGFGCRDRGVWGDEDGWRQRLVGIHDPPFGVGEGPAEAVARRQQCCKTPLSGAGAKGRLSIL